MDTTQTNSPASTGSEGQTTSSPQTQVAPNQTPAQAVFAGSQAPEWVKSAGLEAAHNKAEQKVAPQTQQTTQQQQVQQTQQSPAQTQPVTQPTAQPPAMDPTAIAKAVAEGLRGALPQQQQQTQPQLTDEQLRQQLGVFTATDETYEQLLGVKPDSPARVAALNNILQSVAKQAVTISNLMTQKALADYQQSLNPYITAVQSAEAERQKSLFFKDYPQLTGFEQVVQEQFQLAKLSGLHFPTVEAARKYVADKALERLKSVGVNPQAPAAPTSTTNNPTTSPNTSRQMTTTSVGGRSGASATGKQPANTVEAVWGKR